MESLILLGEKIEKLLDKQQASELELQELRENLKMFEDENKQLTEELQKSKNSKDVVIEKIDSLLQRLNHIDLE